MTQNHLADKHIALPNRGLLRLSGADKTDFLQGLITQDATLLKKPGDMIYALLLTPQGKFLHDFFVAFLPDGDFLIDCEAARREDLRSRLWRYRLRAQITILDETAKWHVAAELPPLAERLTILGYLDPRSPKLGRRHYVPTEPRAVVLPLLRGEVPSEATAVGVTEVMDTADSLSPPPTHCLHNGPPPPSKGGGCTREDNDFSNYEKIRISLGIPDGSRDMVIEKSLPMEFNCDKLKGIALSKGCYLGQEMTSRMFFRDLIKKQTYPALLPKGAQVQTGTAILADGEPVGELRTSCGEVALAYLRIDAKDKQLTADGMAIVLQK